MDQGVAGFWAWFLKLCLYNAIFIGWCLNIKAIFNLEPFIWSGKVVIAAAGILYPPIGAIMGYFVW